LSAALCAECMAQPDDAAPHVVRGDVLAPVLRAGLWDAAISVTVLNHLASPTRRVTALQRMAQLLRPGALGLVTVMAVPALTKAGNEAAPQEPLNADVVPVFSRTSVPVPDMLVPWTLPSKVDFDGNASCAVMLRYHHFFVEGELDRLVLETSCLRVVRSFYDDGNWCVIFCKKDDDPVL